MKKHKLIMNFNSQEEKIIYFDRLTTKKLKLMLENPQYILLVFYDFLKCYIEIQNNLSQENKENFNKNRRLYCERY